MDWLIFGLAAIRRHCGHNSRCGALSMFCSQFRCAVTKDAYSFYWDKRAFAGAGADVPCLLPCLFGLDVIRPERPCATLNRASRVDAAGRFAIN